MFRLLFGAAMARWLDRMVGTDAQSDRDGGNLPAEPASLEVAPPAEPEYAPMPEECVYPRVQRPAMGSMFEVYLAGIDRDSLVGAAEQALDEIQRLDRQLSHYSDVSDITRLNIYAPEQWVRVEPRIYDLFRRCRQLAEATGGAFDITAGPLVKAWGFHDGSPRVPPDDEIATLLQRVGMDHILADDDDNLLHYDVPGLEVTLGAIGKGYAIDEAVDILRMYHVRSAMIHGGQSTIYALGAPPGEDAWEFTVRDPRDHTTPIQTLRLRDEAISTSGNYEQYFDADGVRYSHIIDPRTGRPAVGTLSVSAVARNAAESDAISTALFVMSAAERAAFLSTRADLRVIILIERPDGGLDVARHGVEP
jgi:FAD:protein FMN transferase